MIPTISHVDVTSNGRGIYQPGSYTVTPHWSGVDRPTASSWGVTCKGTAERLARAIVAGVVCVDAKLATDVNGDTYVDYRSTILAREMERELVRLGF